MTKKRPKRGRPSLGRTEYLEVRLSEEEKERVSEAARRNGISISDFVRLSLNACTASESVVTLNIPSMRGTTE
jgi:uncharacterized protein (DUF1778 family)